MEKYGYEQWKKLSLEHTKTKESIEDMSKLYIIAHAKVKGILRKVQTDLDYDPTDDCANALQFIKTIQERLADREKDEFLAKIDPTMLDKYQQNFFGLVQLLRLALITQSSKDKIDVNQLVGVRENDNKRDEFSLRGQLKKSQQRMVRTKSGHRITRQSSAKKSEKDEEYEELIQEKDAIIIDEKAHADEFLSKKQHLEQTINEHIEKQGFSINFRKKYSKLDDYLQERKQFADLLFCQKFYDQMIEEGKTRKNEPKIQEKRDPDMKKIFPQFNIKTKYLKRQVKENILNVIYNVKKQLLNQYHLSNVAKMQEGNQNGMMRLVQKRKSEPKTTKAQSETTSIVSFTPDRFKSTNRTKNQFFRHSMKNLGNTAKTATKKLKWDEPMNKTEKNKLVERLIKSKMPDYGK